MNNWTTKMKTLAAVALLLTPAIAMAHPNRGSSAHMRPNLFHARTAQPHVGSTSSPHH